MRSRALVFTLLLAIAGCAGSADDDGQMDAATVADTGAADTGTEQESGTREDSGSSGFAFGATCAMDSECMSNVCRSFNMIGTVCTQNCSMDVDCPAGSQGQKCNMNGICRP